MVRLCKHYDDFNFLLAINIQKDLQDLTHVPPPKCYYVRFEGEIANPSPEHVPTDIQSMEVFNSLHWTNANRLALVQCDSQVI